jgi:small-conductance mechanosensitive channel
VNSTSGQSILRDLFGNPADGTFLAWMADHGVWATLIALGAILLWYIVRRYIRNKIQTAIRNVAGPEDSPEDNGVATRSVDRLLSTILPAAVIGTTAVIGILVVIGRDVGPVLDFFSGIGTDAAHWVLTGGVRILLIIVFAWVGTKLARRLIPQLMLRVIRDSRDAADRAEASRKRAETLSGVFIAAINVIIILVVIFTILTEINIPIGPVLGGVGIAGIALGFGAQYLVRDVITGTLILLENQYRQGDVVELAGIAGLVESINLRRTVLRDLDGKVHTIPHGEIKTTSNFTKYWSRVVLDIGVAYKENMEHVFRVLNEIGQELGNHPDLGLKVIDPPKVLRLQAFDASQITVRMLGVCKPLTQWELAGWMRLRIKQRFDEEKIEIPFPHQTLYWGTDQPSLPWQQSPDAGDGEPAAPGQPEATADDFAAPGTLSPEQREAMLAEMALAAQAASEQMAREGSSETRLPGQSDE